MVRLKPGFRGEDRCLPPDIAAISADRRAMQTSNTEVGGDFILYAYDSYTCDYDLVGAPVRCRAQRGVGVATSFARVETPSYVIRPARCPCWKRRGRSFDLHREKSEWQTAIEVESARKQENTRLTQRRITPFV